MKTYEQLNESLTKGVPWHYSHRDNKRWTAHFEIEDMLYNVSIQYHKEYPWEIIFDVDGDTNATGTGNAFLVFATVGEIVKDWFNKTHPQSFYFTSETFGSRYMLYNRLSKVIAQRTGYRLEKTSDHNVIVYEFWKPL